MVVLLLHKYIAVGIPRPRKFLKRMTHDARRTHPTRLASGSWHGPTHYFPNEKKKDGTKRMTGIIPLLAVALAVSTPGSAAFCPSRTADITSHALSTSKCLSSGSTSRLLLDDGGDVKDQYDPNAWKAYADKGSTLRRQYEKSGGILYRQSVLSRAERQKIKNDLDALLGKGGRIRLADETSSSVASNRIGARLPPDCSTVKVLADPRGSISCLVNDLVRGREMVMSKEVPVELRIYEKRGAGMEWHVDDVLYSPEQVEIVLTLENTSDCVTKWETHEAGGIAKREGVETSPFSAILLKAGGARHRVSSLKNGRRVILKFVYIQVGAMLLDGAEKHIRQFSPDKKRMKR